ncbi:sigma-70 family RNA polymerase sigma factor [Sporosarcina sp. ANT_H38]|uniref:sigma-70 family RNA polymerase sigma factor n=1 Tax=Sporosarcina sp. ANT_H38 TaxID=2597358 RepID=UPI0011F37827|nr:sigma-70 family RNA polymerase sigma factor [Sporosarcina sp. ANT_H38]KAA0955515.1 sigma-70 family RNA polymerase sigma factor [Sporosarcina sp. ANT_H38]
MTNFEDVLAQYEPMISASIRKLNIYRDHDSFRQAGRVALWHAWTRFDETKGDFTPFAYRSIRGVMLDEVKKESRFEENIAQVEEELLLDETEIKFDIYFGENNELEAVLAILSPTEREIIQLLFFNDLSLAECAERIGTSVLALKQRKRRILVKLRRKLV